VSYKASVPQTIRDNNHSVAFLIEALLACESLWAVLPQPAPLFANELLSALEAAERAGEANRGD
jgi:hypothetical protein